MKLSREPLTFMIIVSKGGECYLTDIDQVCTPRPDLIETIDDFKNGCRGLSCETKQQA